MPYVLMKIVHYLQLRLRSILHRRVNGACMQRTLIRLWGCSRTRHDRFPMLESALKRIVENIWFRKF